MATSSAAEVPQDTPGQYRDASGRRKDTPDGCTYLAEISQRLMDGVYRSLFLSRMSVIRDFYDNIKVFWWEAVTTVYLDPNAYKKGKGKATSQIELRSQNGQM